MNFLNKTWIPVLAAAVLAGSFFGCANGKSKFDLKPADEVVATVGDVSITKADINEEFVSIIEQQMKREKASGSKMTKESLDNLKENVIYQLIQSEIVYKQIDQLIAKSDFVPEENFNEGNVKYILFQEELDTMEQLYARLAKDNGGKADFYKKQYERSFYINEFITKEVIKKGATVPSEEKNKAFYESNKEALFTKPLRADINFIVVNYVKEPKEGETGTSYDEAVVKMDEIIAYLQAGKDFNKIAKKYSDFYDKKTKNEIAKFSKNNRFGYESGVVDKILAVEEGQISEMIDDGQDSLLVVKVNKVYPEKVLPYEEIKKLIEINETGNDEQNGPFFTEVQSEWTSIPSRIVYGQPKEEAADEADDAAEVGDAEAETDADAAVDTEAAAAGEAVADDADGDAAEASPAAETEDAADE